MLTEEQVADNLERIKGQLRAFLRFEDDATAEDVQGAKLVNNAE